MAYSKHLHFQVTVSGSWKKLMIHLMVIRVIFVLLANSFEGDEMKFSDSCRIRHVLTQQYVAVVMNKDQYHVGFKFNFLLNTLFCS